MDIIFKCPVCGQELEVDSSGRGTTIECPSCTSSISVPNSDASSESRVAAPAPPPEPPKVEKHFSVPVHEKATEEVLVKQTSRPLEVFAKDGDKSMRIRVFKRSDCVEVGKDHFDEVVSGFLEKVGQLNIVSINPINYSYPDMATHQIVTDYGVMIVFKG